jgi:hypothetical protein
MTLEDALWLLFLFALIWLVATFDDSGSGGRRARLPISS